MIQLLFWRSSGLVGRVIQWRTGSPWGHVAVYINGTTYEYTWPRAKATDELVGCDAVRELARELTFEETAAVRRYWLDAVRHRRIYNWRKLVSLLVVYPTRWFWDRIGWIPFDGKWWGEVCSTGVDESFRCAHIDLVPYRSEGYTSPGDLWESPMLKEYVCSG